MIRQNILSIKIITNVRYYFYVSIIKYEYWIQNIFYKSKLNKSLIN